jgi:hypothetical protein
VWLGEIKVKGGLAAGDPDDAEERAVGNEPPVLSQSARAMPGAGWMRVGPLRESPDRYRVPMTFARPHGLITFLGDAWTQQEEWQIGLRVDSTDVPTEAELVALADAYAAFHTHTDVDIDGAARFLGVKWAPQDTSGRYPAEGESVTYFRPTPLPGGGGAGNSYPQLSIVVTLGTALPRGRGSMGRFYPPPSTQRVDTDGRIPATNATLYATAAATFIDQVNAVDVGQVCVFSNPDDGAGPVQPVTRIRVGRVVDTQRRRRNQIPELHVEVPLPQ